MGEIKAVIQFKRATSSKWAQLNPILAKGEPGYETDTGKLKIGDGTSTWQSLKYLITEELDPTVPSWAKQENKPTYTASEVGAYNKSEVDTKLNSKANSSHTHTSANITDLASKLEEAKSEVKDDLLGGAGTAFDTLQELANALGQDPNFAATVSNEIGKKANSSDVYKKSEVYTRSEANARYLLSHPLFTENAWGIDWGLDAGKPLGLTVHYGQYALFQVLKGTDGFNDTFDVVVNADSFHRLGNSASDKREIVDEVSLLNLVYPVGSIYMSFNNTSPASFLGGTWTRLSNTFLYASTSDVVASNGARYGSSNQALGISNLPAHKHTTNIIGDQSSSSDWIAISTQWGKYQAITDIVYADDQGMNNSPFSIMPPYTKVYMWRRTA